MSEQSRHIPGDIVKVEVEEDDERNEGNSSDTIMEVDEVEDKDMEMLKAVASLLSNGPWLSSGTEEGQILAEKLLNLGERLVGCKEWERLGRMKGEETRKFAQRLKEAELQLEMVKESKAELRETYELEVDRRIKAEREVAELGKKIAPESGTEVLQDINLDTDNEDLREGRSGEELAKVADSSCKMSELQEEIAPKLGTEFLQGLNLDTDNENLLDGDSSEELAKVADSSCNIGEYLESSGSSSESDDGWGK